jgi:hypothetical protein
MRLGFVLGEIGAGSKPSLTALYVNFLKHNVKIAIFFVMSSLFAKNDNIFQVGIGVP